MIFEVRHLADGGRALPVFTTVRRLVAALGQQQPWVALPLEKVRLIAGGAGVHRVVLDPGAEPGAWRWQPADLEELARRQP